MGGSWQEIAEGLVRGVGGCENRGKGVTAQLAAGLFSMPGVVAVEFGHGVSAAQDKGPACYDAILLSASSGFTRASNANGGLEDGMTSGEQLVITVTVAPPASAGTPKETVNLDTLQLDHASNAHGPVCTVPGIAVAAEAEVAFVLANAYLEQFGSANMTDIRAAVESYTARLSRAAR